MPVRRIKGGERPDESRAGNTAIHHWIFLDICRVIQSDELMPDHLHINRRRHPCQSKQNEEIRPPECRSTVEWLASSLGGNRSSLLRCFPSPCGFLSVVSLENR